MKERLVLRDAVSVTDAVSIICGSDSDNGYPSGLCAYPESCLEVAIVSEVGQVN